MRPLQFLVLFAFLWCAGCGSRTEYGVILSSASRLPDDRVKVTGQLTVSFLGSRSDEVLKEVCVSAGWFELKSSSTDGGAADGGAALADGGTTMIADAGIARITSNDLGARVSTVDTCEIVASRFELTSPSAIPSGRRLALVLSPFESDASRMTAHNGVFSMRELITVSP